MIYKKNIKIFYPEVRNLTSKLAIAKKLLKEEFSFFMALSVNFTSYTRNCKCERAFILCKTSLLLKKDRSLSAENVLVLKFDEIIEITELIILITTL